MSVLVGRQLLQLKKKIIKDNKRLFKAQRHSKDQLESLECLLTWKKCGE